MNNSSMTSFLLFSSSGVRSKFSQSRFPLLGVRLAKWKERTNSSEPSCGLLGTRREGWTECAWQWPAGECGSPTPEVCIAECAWEQGSWMSCPKHHFHRQSGSFQRSCRTYSKIMRNFLSGGLVATGCPPPTGFLSPPVVHLLALW